MKKEELYDEFEEQWQNGIRPNIQTFLERYRATNPAESQSVLREQLCIELDQLLHRGEIPQLTEYKTVFPDDVDCILSSFREISAKVELTPTLDAARFRMIDLLEKGGQGEIWLRYDTLVERLVALKCVASSEWNSPEIQAEFRREAVIGGTLEHPNIAPVYELTEQRHPWGITEPAPPYLVMRAFGDPCLHAAIAAFHARSRPATELPLLGALRSFQKNRTPELRLSVEIAFGQCKFDIQQECDRVLRESVQSISAARFGRRYPEDRDHQIPSEEVE